MQRIILHTLLTLQDQTYAVFQSKLLPTVSSDAIIGVRTPDLRRLAKQLIKTDAASQFLHDLPHKYFDENQLHAFLISEIRDFPTCIAEVERFLPYIDNWATCDQLSPRCFSRHKHELLPHISKLISAEHTYIIRYGIGMLLSHFLDDDFIPEYLAWVASVKSDEYYIRMMQAWYFATALAKQWDAAIPYIEQHQLDVWTHNKTIQKACESYRISPEQKTYLRTLKLN